MARLTQNQIANKAESAFLGIFSDRLLPEDPIVSEQNFRKFKRDFASFLSDSHHGTATAFLDFFRFIVRAWSLTELPEPLTWNYSNEETRRFVPISQLFITTALRKIQENGWFDIPGELYMLMGSSKQDKQAFGQFFTPQNLCDSMVNFTEDDSSETRTICDPCCGSGRMLLASATKMGKDKRICFAKDIDQICTLMTTVNYLIHGVQGVVACGNGIIPHDFRFAFVVNEFYYEEENPLFHIPHCRVLNPQTEGHLVP